MLAGFLVSRFRLKFAQVLGNPGRGTCGITGCGLLKYADKQELAGFRVARNPGASGLVIEVFLSTSSTPTSSSAPQSLAQRSRPQPRC